MLNRMSVQQCKNVLDDAIYRAIIRFESETGSTILGVRVNRLNIGSGKTACTSVSVEVK